MTGQARVRLQVSRWLCPRLLKVQLVRRLIEEASEEDLEDWMTAGGDASQR